MKIRVPEDMVLVGYFNTPWSEAWDLTSVSPQAEEMAKETSRLVKDRERNEKIWIQPKLIFRNSCPG
jgi:DNA-binding LacI/PurR family transcriptional regulator